MNPQEKETNERHRRKAKDIDDAVMAATKKMVVEKGFNNVTFTSIMNEANIEPKVMYKRFDSLLTLFDKFVREYDYWLHDLVGFDLEKNSLVETMKDILIGLMESLNENPVMQKILIWELSEQNYLTTRMSVNRELQSKVILDFFNERTKDAIDFNCLAAILIGGIYYLTLHKDVSSFCERDINKAEDREALVKTIKKILDSIYAPQKEFEAEKAEIASSLLKNGVNIGVIAKSMGLSVKEIKKMTD